MKILYIESRVQGQATFQTWVELFRDPPVSALHMS